MTGTERPLAVLGFLPVSLLIASFAVATDPWPTFRGPNANGIAPSDSHPPIEWNEKQNIAWRIEIPGQGWSTPVVGEKRIYLSAAIPVDDQNDTFDLSLVILDRDSGKRLKTVSLMKQDGTIAAKIHKKNSHASPTPVLAGDRVFVHFGYQGTACCDRDGRVLWTNRELAFRPTHGNGGTPILVDDKLIFTCDGDKQPKVVALDANSGELVWEVPRPLKAKKTFSFCTPTLITVDGKKQVIAPGSDCVLAIDPETGKTIWDVRYTGYSVVPKPVFDNKRVYVSTSFDNASLLAIRPTGTGIVTDSHVDWEIDKNVSKTPSMIVHEQLVYLVSDNGILTCVESETGDTVYRKRLGGGFSASPVMAGGKLYFTNESGQTIVLEPGRKYQLLSENDLGERTLASPAIDGDAILIRTEDALYRIES